MKAREVNEVSEGESTSLGKTRRKKKDRLSPNKLNHNMSRLSSQFPENYF